MKKYLLLFPVLLIVLMSSCNCNKNPSGGDDIDDIDPILEVEKVIITDDFCIKTIYSDGTEECSDKIGLNNYQELYQYYILYNQDYEYDVEAFLDLNTVHNEDDLSYSYKLLNNDTYAITKYNGTDLKITTPLYYQNKRVTCIESEAFRTSSVEEVILSEFINLVKSQSFYFNATIKKVSFLNPNTELEKDAFIFANGLVTVELPKNLTILNAGTFKNCKALKEIKNTDSITTIGNECFLNCRSLESFDFSDSITYIGVKAFSNCSLKSIVLPKHLEVLEDQSFNNCTSLESITFNDSLRIINAGCFTNCNLLKEVNFNDNLEELCGGAFEQCSSLEEVIFPNSLRTIGSGCFQECINIRKVVVNEGLTDLSASCFNKCVNLVDLQLSSTINFMSHSCFSGCTSLKKVVLPNNLRAVYDGVFNDCTALEEINIPESVKLFGGSCLAGCSSLKTLIIHDGVTTITAGSFRGCSSLETIRIPYFGTSPDNNMSFDVIFGTVPSSLKTVIIGDACESIPENAFSASNKIEKIEFGKNIKYINKNSLTGLTMLKEIVFKGNEQSFKSIITDESNLELINKVTIKIEELD